MKVRIILLKRDYFMKKVTKYPYVLQTEKSTYEWTLWNIEQNYYL